MINGVNINYLVIVIVTGAVMLAAVYHTVLYMHRRTRLLAHYSIYLWATVLFTGFRFFYPLQEPEGLFLQVVNADETLQMFAFAMYIRFIGTALDLDKKMDKYAWFFVTRSVYVIIAYILVQIVFVNIALPDIFYLTLKVLIRAYLLFVGLFMLLTVMLQRKKLYYNYLAAGAIAIIFFGIISTVVNMINIKHHFLISAVSWIMMGFFLDVIFFSSAIGYRIKTDALEKEQALNMLIKQNEILQQKEIENIQAIYKTKEEERLRIANDLHDDIGASLSSLQIYSTIAEQNITANPSKTVEMVQRIAAQSKLLLENMSDIVWSMKTAIDSTTLEAKIKNYGVELLTDRDINFHYQISKEAEAALQNIYARKNILLLIKEAMNNIAKYSSAKEARLLMEIRNDMLILEVIDSGAGFDSTKPSSGFGLKNMRHRVNELKGTINIKTAVGEGTVIEINIPVSAIKETG
jgi:signal transduction histidine kinase